MRARFLFGVTVMSTIAAMSTPVLADWSSTITAANPLHWFRFEETSGTTAADSGSANVPGSYTGGVTLGTAGVVGNAATFDGVNGHVAVNGPNLTGDWTVEAILCAGAGGVSQGILGSATMALKAEQWENTNKLGYTVFGVVDVTLDPPTPADYTHLAFVGSSGGVSLYVNGALADSDATTTVVGRQVFGAGRINPDGALVDPLQGSIDELVYFDRALSGADIASHYQSVPEPSAALLLLLGAAALVRRRHG